MEKVKVILKNWPLHLTILAVAIVCEAINTISIPTPLGNIMFLPMLFCYGNCSDSVSGQNP